MSTVVLRMFGEFCIESDNIRAERFDTQRAAKLLAVVGLSRNRRMGRDELADMLWPDDFPDATRLRLRQELSRVRKALGDLGDIFITDAQTVALDGGRVESDLGRLARALRIPADAAHRDSALHEATQSIEGDFLAGWDDPWVVAERAQAHALRRDAWYALAQARLEGGDGPGALSAASRICDLDPADEPARLIVIQAHALLGSLTNALSEFQRMKRALRDGYDRDPSSEAEQLMASIHAGEVTVPGSGPTAAPVPWRAIPAALSRTFGRTEDRETVADLLSGGTRCITLLGPGGIGKTHLALEILREHQLEFSGGVGMVPLAEIGDADGFASALLHQSGLHAPDNLNAIEFFGRALGNRSAFLLLDNAEHLLPDLSSDIRRLLESAPQLTILVTSRTPVQIEGERVVRLRPLDAAVEGRDMLFDLWRGLRPQLKLSDDSAAALEELAKRLDGYPLAIRLVAPRLKLRSPAEVLRDLGRTPIAAESDDIPARHRNLTRLIQSSLDDLDEARRDALVRLTYFRAGATIDQAVSALGGDDALDRIDSLVDASLVVLDEGENLRVRCLELVGEAARDSASADGLRVAECRFIEVVREHVRREIPGLFSPLSATQIERLDEDAENVHAALALAEQLNPALHVDLVCAWWRQEQARGRYRHIVGMCTAALAHGVTATDDQRGELHLAAGTAWASQGDDRTSVEHLAQSVEAFALAKNLAGEAVAQAQYAHIERRTEGIDAAIERARAAVQLAESSGHTLARAFCQVILGDLYVFCNDRVQAQSCTESAYRLAAAAGDDVVSLLVGLRYASTLYGAGSFVQADATLASMEALADRLGDPVRRAFAHEVRGRTLLALGKPGAGEKEFRDSYRLWQQMGNAFQMADQSLSIARCLVDQEMWSEGESWLVRSGDLWAEANDFGGLNAAMSTLGRCLIQRGEIDRAREVFGYQAAMARELGLVLVDAENEYRDAWHAKVGALIEPSGVTSGLAALGLFHDALGSLSSIKPDMMP